MSEIFLDNKYTAAYFRIIERRRIKRGFDYSEEHHIVPESFFINRTRRGPAGWLEGDADHHTNRVQLRAKEHFICHWLLTMMTEGVARQKCLLALKGMRASSKKHSRYHGKITASVYAALKSDIANAQREAMLGDRNHQYGKKWTEEQKIEQGNKVRGEKNGMKSDKSRETMKKIKTGVSRGKFSDEWCENLSKSSSGENNGMYGKSHREESKKLQKEKAEQKAWVNDGNTSKRVDKNSVQSYLDSGWLRGRHYVARGSRGPYKKKQTS